MSGDKTVQFLCGLIGVEEPDELVVWVQMVLREAAKRAANVEAPSELVMNLQQAVELHREQVEELTDENVKIRDAFKKSETLVRSIDAVFSRADSVCIMHPSGKHNLTRRKGGWLIGEKGWPLSLWDALGAISNKMEKDG